MPYQRGTNLPGEFASKVGHLDVVNSELMDELVANLEFTELPKTDKKEVWEDIPKAESLTEIFGVDGSSQPIPYEDWPYARLFCVKVALVSLNSQDVNKLNENTPHPMEIRDILSQSVIRHVNLFPLRHVQLSGINTYNAVRKIIFEGLQKHDKLKDEVLKTLKWLVFEKWNDQQFSLPNFDCPNCEKSVATLSYDAEIDKCPNCSEILYLTDWLGFHLRMLPDNAPDEVGYDYMNIYELLLLFTKIRLIWENDKSLLSKCLFVKDGPLQLSSQFARLVPRIRKFFVHARDSNNPVYLVGQEKSGKFFDHLQMISKESPDSKIFVLNDKYVKEQVQQRPDRGFPYGQDTNYGAKVFVKLNMRDKMVLSIPIGDYKKDPKLSDLIGVDKILTTIPKIMSRRFEGALLPIELAHSLASLSNYPSAKIIKDYAKK